MLFIAWKRGLSRKFAHFFLFRPIEIRSFNLSCVFEQWIIFKDSFGIPLHFSLSSNNQYSLFPDAGCSTGRSSVFSCNSFGPKPEPKLGVGAPFPRPLISPARLSVVSFSPFAGLCGSTWMFVNFVSFLQTIILLGFVVPTGEKKLLVWLQVTLTMKGQAELNFVMKDNWTLSPSLPSMYSPSQLLGCHFFFSLFFFF